MSPSVWPASLSWILEALGETTHRDSLDGTSPHSSTTEHTSLKGVVELDLRALALLQELAGTPGREFLCDGRRFSFLAAPVVQLNSVEARLSRSETARRFVKVELLVH